jgi:hypothetical protein
LRVGSPGILGNDTDPDAAALTVKDADPSVSGTQSANGPSKGRPKLGADSSFNYRPRHNFHGTDSFSYTATDDVGTATSPP